MQTSLRGRRSRLARPLSWLVVAGLAGAALIGPGAGTVGASNEPGSPDFVPNSGHTSSSGLTLTMGTATISCDGDSAGSFDGSFTFSGSGHVVLYLAANNGSNASPAGNVQNNEITIDLTGKTSPVSFSLPVTSGFTATSGGVLVVFASDVSGKATYTSKSNSLNCSDSTTSSSTSTSTESSTTSTDTSSTSTESSSTSTESTGTESSTTESSSTSTESTGTESSTTSTESTSTESTGTESSTTETTSTESTGTVSDTTSTQSTSEGGVLGAEGTPGVTPPPTDTVAPIATTTSPDGYRFILLGLAVLLAVMLLLQPSSAATARKANADRK